MKLSSQIKTLPENMPLLRVQNAADAAMAAVAAKELAKKSGFPSNASEEIALCAKELATNTIEHANGGIFGVRMVTAAEGDHIELWIEDDGPGIRNIQDALIDGLSSQKSYGCGLGTVHRLMDTFEIFSPIRRTGGVRICSIRKLRTAEPKSPKCPLDIGVVTRPHPGFKVNGDTFIIKGWGTKLLTGVIDGLGHGELAYKASMVAREYVERHYDQPLKQLFMGVDVACRGTRGVVMALALFDWAENTVRIASVGNVEIKTYGRNEKLSVLTKRGFLGSGIKTVTTSEDLWLPHETMIMFSDGISSTWEDRENDHYNMNPAQKVAARILAQYSKDHDDATVLVIKEAAR